MKKIGTEPTMTTGPEVRMPDDTLSDSDKEFVDFLRNMKLRNMKFLDDKIGSSKEGLLGIRDSQPEVLGGGLGVVSSKVDGLLNSDDTKNDLKDKK